ncbi:hypothetical protein LTR28_003773 [Elasticomyces elasticus]|nr:hypothetical protein LTR28_003773 [Elasticomyces elasticus]
MFNHRPPGAVQAFRARRITPRLVDSAQLPESTPLGQATTTASQDTIAISQETVPTPYSKEPTSKNTTTVLDDHNPTPLSTFPGAFEVEAIIDHRQEEDGYEYLIHWAGCDESERTWEPPRHVVPGALDTVLEYHAQKRRWFGNIEAILDRKPSLQERDTARVPGAKYKVRWEGWEAEKWQTWEALDFKEYQDIIYEWLEREWGRSIRPVSREI